VTNPYGKILVDHFRRPRNRGSMVNPTVSEEGVNRLCGDRVRIELRLDGSRVAESKFTANACALCVAAASVLTELATGAPLDEVDTLTLDDLLRVLDTDVPEARRNCVRLPLTVLHAGVMLHRRTHHLPSVDRSRPVAAIVLAAGKARRFGAQKLLAPYGSSTVVRTVVDTVRAAGVDYLVVVGGPGGDAVRAAVGASPVVWAENAEPDRGLSSSVATGVAAMPPNVGAVLVVLGDQPTVSVQVMQRVMLAWREGGGPVVAPRYRGIRGNPVLFDSTLFGALGSLVGEHGARDLISSDPTRVTMVEVAEPPPMDIDTPGDYDELLRRSRT
jgi:CTP:molybdopterin cytidylyltransferase MocA/NifU-like protein involved in Fe-S cluster formation